MVMSLALDFACFGNGHGMGQPYFDGVFYWLVDTLASERAGSKGRLYKAYGWFGCQLSSTQWTHPKPGERRRLNGREYIVFSSTRRGFRVQVTWRLVELDQCDGIDGKNEAIRRALEELKRL